MIIGVAVKVGDVVMALPSPYRHSDAINALKHLGLDSIVANEWSKADNQGFIDQFGKYYTRPEAAKRAFEHGQLNVELTAVCSEDLW